MGVEEIVLFFRQFLIKSWPIISQHLDSIDWDEDAYFLDDWMQANWELLVERQLGKEIFLLPYGYDKSSMARYLSKGHEANHQIICTEKHSSNAGKYEFLCFLTADSILNDNLTYKIDTPFDFVRVKELDSSKQVAFPVDKITFNIISV